MTIAIELSGEFNDVSPPPVSEPISASEPHIATEAGIPQMMPLGDVQLSTPPTNVSAVAPLASAVGSTVAPPPLSDAAQLGLEESDLDRPPVEIAALAKGEAIARASSKLQEKFNFTAAAATAISAAVVDPAELRKRIETPLNVRIPGGALIVIPTEVWTLRVAIDCTNPRAARRQQFQFGWRGAAQQHIPPISQPEAVPDRCELQITVNDRAHHDAIALQAQEEVRLSNPAVLESVPRQGVMVPVMLAVTHVNNLKTGEKHCALSTVDGSSRLTASQKSAAGGSKVVSPTDPFYKYADNRELNSIIKKARTEYGEINADKYEEQESILQRNRCMTIPAFIVVGFRSDANQQKMDFSDAVQSYRGLCHVAPPTQWDDAGQRDAQSEGVISQLRNASLIDEIEAAYIAGTLTQNVAIAHQYCPELDSRAIRIGQRILASKDKNRKIHQAVGRGIKAMCGGAEAHGRTSKSRRAEVAAELMIRPLRTWFAGNYTNTIRSAIERAVQCEYFKDGRYGISGLAPDDLLERALSEIDDGNEPGPHAIELAFRGMFWLCVTRNLMRASSQNVMAADVGQWTEPPNIVKRLAQSAWGLRILHRAIIDGRAFVPNPVDPKLNSEHVAKSVYAISAEGTQIATATGPRRMDAAWIKHEVLKQGDAADTKAEEVSPDKLYGQLWSEIRTGIGDLRDKLDAMYKIKDSHGRRLVEVIGVIPADGEVVEDDLAYLSRKVMVTVEQTRERAQHLEENPIGGEADLDGDADPVQVAGGAE